MKKTIAHKLKAMTRTTMTPGGRPLVYMLAGDQEEVMVIVVNSQCLAPALTIYLSSLLPFASSDRIEILNSIRSTINDPRLKINDRDEWHHDRR